MKIEIKEMPMHTRKPSDVTKKVRPSKYRFGELNIGEGYELLDKTELCGHQNGVTVLLNRIRAAASLYSKRNGIEISVGHHKKGRKRFITVRRDA